MVLYMCNCVCGHEVRCACVYKGVAVLTTDLAMGGGGGVKVFRKV